SKGPAGRAVSRFELWYAARPKGGRIRLQVDKEEPILLETAADELEDRWHVLEVEDGAHSLSVRAAGGGKVRAYGVVLERDGPGVVWDGMSQIGAMTRRMLNFDPDHLQRQLRRRQSNMVVLMFGGNDMGPHLNLEKYKESFSLLLRGIKAAGPHMSCLVMAPLDHGERKGHQIVTRDIVPELVEAQREVAEAAGCAFFDTYAAMGGDGSMGRWARAEPRLGSGDLSHLTHHGHKVIGAMVYRALMDGYRDFRGRVEGKPMRALAALADHGVAVAEVDAIDLDALVGEVENAEDAENAAPAQAEDAAPQDPEDPEGTEAAPPSAVEAPADPEAAPADAPATEG
ncbi:MAG: GDSL-type esterase/lipase family protein, partial [Nannocystaceae bacterium]